MVVGEDEAGMKFWQRKTLIRGSQAEYVDNGYLLYVLAGTLHAVRFDLEKLEVLGNPVPIVPDVATSSAGASNYGISRSGTLITFRGARVQAARWCGLTGNGTFCTLRIPRA
jgi:hypothetical protein